MLTGGQLPLTAGVKPREPVSLRESRGLHAVHRLSLAGPSGSQGLNRPLRNTAGVLLDVLNLMSGGLLMCQGASPPENKSKNLNL